MPGWGETRNEARCAARKPGPDCGGGRMNALGSSWGQGVILGPFVVLWQLWQFVGQRIPMRNHQQRARLARQLGKGAFRQAIGFDEAAQIEGEFLEVACAAASFIDRLERPLRTDLASSAAGKPIQEPAYARLDQKILGMDGPAGDFTSTTSL